MSPAYVGGAGTVASVATQYASHLKTQLSMSPSASQQLETGRLFTAISTLTDVTLQMGQCSLARAITDLHGILKIVQFGLG